MSSLEAFVPKKITLDEWSSGRVRLTAGIALLTRRLSPPEVDSDKVILLWAAALAKVRWLGQLLGVQ
jgi:hypothetical protein